MSLTDEFAAESQAGRDQQYSSSIDRFLAEQLTEDERQEVKQWVLDRKNISAAYRVLKRRGLSVAEPTFRHWVMKCR